eukprot:scaffold3026_cov221-Pinguiococcus_pyrenoidosus.AAC.2
MQFASRRWSPRTPVLFIRSLPAKSTRWISLPIGLCASATCEASAEGSEDAEGSEGSEDSEGSRITEKIA